MSHRRYVSFSFRCTCAYNCINSYRSFSFTLSLRHFTFPSRCAALSIVQKKNSRLRLQWEKIWLTNMNTKTIFLKRINGQYLSRFVNVLKSKSRFFFLLSHPKRQQGRLFHILSLFFIYHRYRTIFFWKKEKRRRKRKRHKPPVSQSFSRFFFFSLSTWRANIRTCIIK